MNDNLLIIPSSEVASILTSEEVSIVDIIRQAYLMHQEGKSSLPFSTFLRFPDNTKDRIIGLPTYIGGDNPVAGLKWVSSFPENINRGIDRASAVIILNNMKSGRPYSILEGSIISAKRTAASAALATSILHRQESPNELSLIGGGLINYEIMRFVTTIFPTIKRVYVFDLDKKRSIHFAEKVRAEDLEAVVCSSIDEACGRSKLVSLATTASTPHMSDPTVFQPGSTILHVSLRDLSPNVIRNSINIVDDREHVNRENTSINLTFKEDGNMSFIAAELGEFLLEKRELADPKTPIIFSPFGLGVLDIKLAQFVYNQALHNGLGQEIGSFLPS